MFSLVESEVAADGERLLLDLRLRIGLDLGLLELDLGVELDLGRSRLTRASRFAGRAAVFVLLVRAAVAVRAAVFQLAVRARVAVRAAVFPLAMRTGVAVRAVAFQLAMRARVAVRAVVLSACHEGKDCMQRTWLFPYRASTASTPSWLLLHA